MPQTPWFPVVNDSALAALILKTHGKLPKNTGLVVANAYGAVLEGTISMAVGLSTVSVSGTGSFNFELQVGWLGSHDILLAWVAGAPNFHAITVHGSFPVSKTVGAIVLSSEDPNPTLTGTFSGGGTGSEVAETGGGTDIVNVLVDGHCTVSFDPAAVSQTITVGYISFGT